MKRYLFISGCPRSGTTGLAKMMGWAPECFMGQERFNLLFNRDNTRFVPALFEPNRIRTFEPFDAGYDTFEGHTSYIGNGINPAMLGNLDTATVFGDKLISLWHKFDIFNRPEWADQTVHILHTVRNVQDVAASYHARFENAADGWQEDFTRGIQVWSNSIQKAHRWVFETEQRPTLTMSIIDYDNLFEADQATFVRSAQTLFEQVGMTFAEAEERGIEELFGNVTQFRARRAQFPELQQRVNDIVSADTLEKYARLRAASVI